MLYRTAKNNMIDLSGAEVTLITQGPYTVCFLEAPVQSYDYDQMINRKTVGISKYNPNDDLVIIVPISGGDKAEFKRIRMSALDADFGKRVALGRALSAMRKENFNNYSSMLTNSLPADLVAKVFVKTKKDRALLQQQLVENDEEVVTI